MRDLQSQRIVLLSILGVWAISFFLPAVNFGKPPGDFGYIAAGLSLTAAAGVIDEIRLHHVPVGFIYLGSFWIGNIFMFAAFSGLRRVRAGRGGVLLALMAFWDLLTLSYRLYVERTGSDAPVMVGWWVWEASLFAMTTFLFLVRRNSFSARA